MAKSEATAAMTGPAMEEWIFRAAEHGLRLEELLRLSSSHGNDLRHLLDAIAYRVAEQYVGEAWGFAFCRRVMNEVFGLMRETRQCPDLAFAIFFAFCAGENTQGRPPQGLSAEDQYTKPMMARILPGRWRQLQPRGR